MQINAEKYISEISWKHMFPQITLSNVEKNQRESKK